MTCYMKRVFKRFLQWLARHAYDEQVECWRKQLADLEHHANLCEKVAERVDKEMQKLRAFHVQLRVYQMQKQVNKHNARSGYAVTAFIAKDTLDKLCSEKDLQEAFKRLIVDTLVEQSLKGVWHIHSMTNRPVAMALPMTEGGDCVGMLVSEKEQDHALLTF